MSPDEAVAIGAASPGGALAAARGGRQRRPGASRRRCGSSSPAADGQLIKVTNITTHTLGVVLWDDVRVEEYVFPMIRKMTPVPVQTKNSFGTAKANMKNAIVRVVEGESTVPSECTPLGICDIELPPFLPKGSPVELTYSYNENQVLEVVVEAYGRQNRVSIARNTGLSDSEIATATADLSLITVV